MTGSRDPPGEPNRFNCQLCRRDVSVLTRGSFENLRQYKNAKHFVMDQRLRLETSGLRVLNFSANPISDEEVERQRAKIVRTPLVRRDRENIFCEGLICNETNVLDPQLPILAKVSSLLEVFPLGGSYELVEQLWTPFSLTASCINSEICFRGTKYWLLCVSVQYEIRIGSGKIRIRSKF